MRWIFVSLLIANLVLLIIIVKESYQKEEVAISIKEPVLSDGKALVLLSELESEKRRAQPVETVRLDDLAADSVTQSRALCTLVGSFVDDDSANLFVERLAVLDVDAKVKHLLISKTVGYWLHLPPLGSRKELLRNLGELQRQGIDSYIIPDGDLENGISLGMFSESTRATAMQNKVIGLGYQAAILEVPREKREIWVFLQQQESTKINQERWSELISGKDLLQKQQNLCSDVASR